MTQTTSPTSLIDVHDMVVVHRAFRREFGLLPGLVRAVPAGDTARAAVLAAHLRLCLDGLHLHHTGEDAMLWPVLLERATPSADVVHRMEADHERVHQRLEVLRAALGRWETEARPAVTEEVAAGIESLAAVVLPHLADEEREILPLAARHITQTEWDELGEHGVSRTTFSQLPILFGAVAEEATPEEMVQILGTVPPPVRFLLRTVFARQYRRYISRVRTGR